MSTTKIAEVYNITGSLEIGNKLKIDLWSHLREQYCDVKITLLGTKNVFTSKEESLIVLGENNLFYKIESTVSQDWGDWKSQPIANITNNETMDYVKYNIPVAVYISFIGAISAKA
jgi:hypothetical protein